MKVTCPYCGDDAELVKGDSIYPHRADLRALNFWRCAPCDAHVGCHAKNKRLGFAGIEPKGRLADESLRKARMRAHEAFDPLWRHGTMSRTEAYQWLAGEVGIPVLDCHIGEFDEAMCERVVRLCRARRFPLIPIAM